MLSFETLFVQIGRVDLEIFDFAVISEIRVVKMFFCDNGKSFWSTPINSTDYYSTHQGLSYEL